MKGTFQRRNIKAIVTQQPPYSLVNSSNYSSSLNNSSVSYAKPPIEMNSANRATSLDRFATTTAQSQIINQDITKKEINVDFNQLRQDITNSIKILSSPICERSFLDDSQRIQLKQSDSNAQISAFTDRSNQQPNSKRENYYQQQPQKKIDMQQSKENIRAGYQDRPTKEYEFEDRLRNQRDIQPYKNIESSSSQQQNSNQFNPTKTQKYISPIPISNHSFESQIFRENNNYSNLIRDSQQKYHLNQSFNYYASNPNSAQKDVGRNASFDFGRVEKLYADKPLSYQPLKQFNSQNVYIEKRNEKNSQSQQQYSSSFTENDYVPRPTQSISHQINSAQSSQRSNYQQQKQQENSNQIKNTNQLRTSNSSTASSIKNFSFQVQLNSLNNNNNKENTIDENGFNNQTNQSIKQNTNGSQDEQFSNYSQNFECQKYNSFQNQSQKQMNQHHNNSLSSANYINSHAPTAQSSRREHFNEFLNDLQIGFDHKNKPNSQSQQQLLYTHIQLAEEDLDQENSNKQSIQTPQLYEPGEQTFQNMENQLHQISRSNSRSSSHFDRMKESEIKELKTVLNDSNQQVKDLLKENRKLNEKYQNVNEELIKTQHKFENLQNHYQELQLKFHTEKASNLKSGDLQNKHNELLQKYEESIQNNKQLLDKIDKANQSAQEKVSKLELKYDQQTEKLEKAIERIDQLTVKNTELMISSQKEKDHLLLIINEQKEKQENEFKEKQLLRLELQEEKKLGAEVKFLKAQCEMSDLQLKEKGEHIEQLQRQILEKTKQNDILNQSIFEKMTQLQEIQTENKHKEIEIKAQNSKLIQENQTLMESVEISRIEKETLNSKLKRLTQNMDEIEAIRSENQDLAQQFKEMYQENEKLLNALREKEIESEENEHLVSSIETLKEKNESLQQQNQLINMQLQDATSEIMNLHHQSKLIEKQLKDAQLAYDELKSNSIVQSRQVEEFNECQEQMQNYKQKYTQLKQRQLIEAEKHQQFVNKFQELEKSYDHLLKEYNEMKANMQQAAQIKQKFNEQNQKLEEMQMVAQQNAQNEQMLLNLQSIIQQQEQAINSLNNERQNLLNNNQFKQQIAQAQQDNQNLVFKLTEKSKENEYLKMQMMNFNQTDGIINELKSKLTHVLNENQRLNQILYERCKNSWN